MKEFFRVNVSKYDSTKEFTVVRPSSLNNPKNNSVMFITKDHIDQWERLLAVNNCIIIWPEEVTVPDIISQANVIIRHHEPRQGFALFFKENDIVFNLQPKPFHTINGAYVCDGAKIGLHTIVFPGAYIDSEVDIGENCIIGSGVRLVGSVRIGNHVIIRENAVIGSEGLTTCRDENGKVVTTPQFGGVSIEDNVQIGAMTVIAKGAIDDTVIRSGCRIDNSCFISHNVLLGEDTLVVGETIMFGSSSTGAQVFISGNSTIRDGVYIGEKAFIGMASNVLKNVPNGKAIKGNPAK